MAVEIAPAPDRTRLAPISWPAVFASLAVGISVMLLLTLTGMAVGLTAVDPAAASTRTITIGVATWQAISMLVAAFVGGYVAARLSGLRRTADGVLHGAVSWGTTTVVYAALATTALGSLTAGMFGLLQPPSDRSAPSSTSASAPALDRDQMQRRLEGMGISADQSRSIAEKLAAPVAGGTSGTRQQSAADTAGAATGWLSATVLLALVLSTIGGGLGVRGSRRINRRFERHTVAPATTITTTAPVVDTTPGALSRQT